MDRQSQDGRDPEKDVQSFGEETVEAVDHASPPVDDLDPKVRKRIIRKIDLRLVTATGLMFAVSLMARTNLGYAAIAGMEVDLDMETNNRFNICILIFFVPYVIFQWPAAIVAKKFGPRIVLPLCVVIWGAVTLCLGFIHNWIQMAGLRVLLGVLEAGLLPGAVYLLSSWYCRYDVHKRFSVFYLVSLIGGNLSGVISCGFMQMGGVGGLAAWRYIFIWQGVLIVVVGLASAWLIIDFPSQAHNTRHFLSREEIDIVLEMLRRDRGESDEEKFQLKSYLKCALDIKVWVFGYMLMSATIVAYAMAFFLPIILQSKMGYGVIASQALSTPPFFFAGIFMYVQGVIGDKFRSRGPLIVFNCLQTICGLCILAFVVSPGAQYFGIFLVCGSSNAQIPVAMAYQANNVRETWKRAFTSSSLYVMGGLGGIVGSLVYRSQDAPDYLLGVYASIGFSALAIILVGLLSLHLHRMNRKADIEGLVLEGHPDFRYTL